MITSEVTTEQLEKWQKLHNFWKGRLTANRIGGTELDKYFREKYKPVVNDTDNFRMIVYLNSKAYSPDADISDIRTYALENDIYVGINISTGYFHVECEDITRAVPIWDDLLIKRGLSSADINNYVLTGQYLELCKL